MNKVKDVSFRVCMFALCVLMLCIFANVKFPNEVVSSPFIGIKEMTVVFKAIDVYDFWIFVVSGFVALVAYVREKLSWSW
jgi:hypothetical protein